MTVTATMHDLQLDDWALGRPVDDEWVELIETQNQIAAVYQQVPISLQGFGDIEELPVMLWTPVWKAVLHVPSKVEQVTLSVNAESNTGGTVGTVQFRITDGTNTATTASITTLAEETATLTLAAAGDVTLTIEAQVTLGNAPVYAVMVEFVALTAGALP